MKTVIDNLKRNLATSAPVFSGVTQAQIKDWEATTNIYIAKLMAMGGYTRNDIMQNVVVMLKNKNIIWSDLAPEHHAALHGYLEGLIAQEVREIASKISGNPFVVVAVDPEIVTMVDMGLEANSLADGLPESVTSILRALT